MNTQIDFTGFFDSNGRFVMLETQEDLIIEIISLSEKARRDGLLVLEDDIPDLGLHYLLTLLTMVIDGIDPQIVRATGEARAQRILHDMGQIYDCIKFVLLNWDREAFDARYDAFVRSKTLSACRDMVDEIKNQLLDHMKSEGLPGEVSERYRDILCAAKVLEGDREILINNHLASISHASAVVCDIILTGVLAIQSGDNPRLVGDRLGAMINCVRANSLMEKLQS